MKGKRAPHLIDVNNLRVACSSCSLRELCLPAGLDSGEMERVDRLVTHRHKLKRGADLYRAGEPLAALYAIRSGFMKRQFDPDQHFAAALPVTCSHSSENREGASRDGIDHRPHRQYH